MNKKIFLGIYIVLIGLMSSCNRPSADCPYSIDFLPCENEENDKDAMLDRNGRLFSVSQEDAWKLTPVINGYSLIDDIVYKVGQSLADTTAIAHDVEFCGIRSEGLMPISKSDDYIRIIDEKGNEVFILKEFEGKEVLACYSYSDSKLRVILEDGSVVYLDKTGKMLFGSRFSWGTDFRQGHAVVQNLKQNSEDGILCVDKDNKEVLVEGTSVICALGQKSCTDTVEKLRDTASFVRVIGDAAKVATITNAVYWGYHAALDI